jgi:hypothetical protein
MMENASVKTGGKGYRRGTTVPADATAGYAPGCIFIHTDGGVGTTLYINEGTYASCDFNPMTALVPGEGTVTNAMMVAGTLTNTAINASAAIARSKLAGRTAAAKTETASLTAAECQYGYVNGTHATVAIALTLPTDVTTGADVIIASGGAAAVTVVCAAGFGGAGASHDTVTLGVGDMCHCYFDGTNWYALNATVAA